jgi:hypothetical protein
MQARPTLPHSRKAEIQQEALNRAITGQSLSNYPAIIRGFTDKGIPEDAIKPRENVFTYEAWRALGRHVRKGEHGVKVVTFITCERKVEDADTGETKVEAYQRPWTTTVFHVTQTDPSAKGK